MATSSCPAGSRVVYGAFHSVPDEFAFRLVARRCLIVQGEGGAVGGPL